MSQGKEYRHVLPNTDSRGRRQGREIKKIRRQDWGYTDQYRRMMQRFPEQRMEESEN